MKCIKCERTATPVVKFGKVTSYTCEYCGRSFSIRDNGQASPEELKSLREEQFRQVMKTGTYTPLRVVLARKGGIPYRGKTKMYDPMER